MLWDTIGRLEAQKKYIDIYTSLMWKPEMLSHLDGLAFFRNRGFVPNQFAHFPWSVLCSHCVIVKRAKAHLTPLRHCLMCAGGEMPHRNLGRRAHFSDVGHCTQKQWSVSNQEWTNKTEGLRTLWPTVLREDSKTWRHETLLCELTSNVLAAVARQNATRLFVPVVGASCVLTTNMIWFKWNLAEIIRSGGNTPSFRNISDRSRCGGTLKTPRAVHFYKFQKLFWQVSLVVLRSSFIPNFP